MLEALDGWGPWYAARFGSEEGRDRFLLVVTSRKPGRDEAEPMADEARGAWVRWRPREFPVLNDIAYSHGGRVVFSEKRSA